MSAHAFTLTHLHVRRARSAHSKMSHRRSTGAAYEDTELLFKEGAAHREAPQAQRPAARARALGRGRRPAGAQGAAAPAHARRQGPLRWAPPSTPAPAPPALPRPHRRPRGAQTLRTRPPASATRGGRARPAAPGALTRPLAAPGPSARGSQCSGAGTAWAARCAAGTGSPELPGPVQTGTCAQGSKIHNKHAPLPDRFLHKCLHCNALLSVCSLQCTQFSCNSAALSPACRELQSHTDDPPPVAAQPARL